MLPWWVRLSIQMLPRTFRDQFGADLADSITALAAAARASGGRRGRLAYLAAETVGLWRLAISRRADRPSTLDTPRAQGASMISGLFDELRWAVRHARRRPITVAPASAAGLLMRSLDAVRMQDPGFSAERVLVAEIGLPSSAPAEPGRITLDERSLLDAVAALPRVRAVATAYDHPLEANCTRQFPQTSFSMLVRTDADPVESPLPRAGRAARDEVSRARAQ